MKKLTQAIAREYVRRLGGKLNKTDYDDYRMRLDGAEYYTDSLDDIVGTARAMCGSHPNIESAERYLCESLGFMAYNRIAPKKTY